jgi:hypothetical protein
MATIDNLGPHSPAALHLFQIAEAFLSAQFGDRVMHALSMRGPRQEPKLVAAATKAYMTSNQR